jgi:hypothetical protein
VTDFRYSTELFPLVVMTCPAHFEPSDVSDVLEAYAADVIAARRTFTLVVDATPISELPTALVRRTITDWMKRMESVASPLMLGIALVTSSAIIRGAMTAVNWVVPPRVPMAYEPTLDAGIAWAITRLESRGLVTEPMREYHRSLSRAAS